MQETEKIWMNGELVDWADAKVHVGSPRAPLRVRRVRGDPLLRHGEGPRGLPSPRPPRAARDSASVLFMDLPYSVAELRSATHELVKANGLPTCYLRPIAFYGYGELGVATTGNPVDVVILSFPWGAYLGEEGQRTGISTMVSSWERVGPNVIPHVAKATGIYLNSCSRRPRPAEPGTTRRSCSRDGYVADGPGENLAVMKGSP